MSLREFVRFWTANPFLLPVEKPRLKTLEGPRRPLRDRAIRVDVPDETRPHVRLQRINILPDGRRAVRRGPA